MKQLYIQFPLRNLRASGLKPLTWMPIFKDTSRPPSSYGVVFATNGAAIIGGWHSAIDEIGPDPYFSLLLKDNNE